MSTEKTAAEVAVPATETAPVAAPETSTEPATESTAEPNTEPATDAANTEAATEPKSDAAPETAPESAADKTKEAAVGTEKAAAPKPAPETPLTKLAKRLPDAITKADYSDMWGVKLQDLEHVPTKVILQKFLKANNDDAAAAEKQLIEALKWRKKMNPAALVDQVYDRSKFDDLGYVTVHKEEGARDTVITWNIYGSVKSYKKTFGDIEAFIKWRTALMEISVQKLNLNDITSPIPEGGEDPYQMLQVHDYKSVSFFRLDPAVKAASKETIQTFAMAYPELLSQKYFVNVPAIMGFLYGIMKVFVAPATLKKFHPMTSGTTLATELKGISSSLPEEYGGKGPTVKEGITVALTEVEEPKKKDVVPEGSSEAPVAAVDETKSTEKAAEEAEPAVAATEEAKPVTEESKVEPTEEAPKATTEESAIAEEAKPAAAEEAKPSS